jgi:uncharacterized membrane protein YdfJ with MMPL/SSD domain
MTALGGAISLATVPAALVAVGFGAVLGLYLVRQVEPQGGRSDDAGKPVGGGRGRAGGAVLFFGVLTFAAMLPWLFVDLRLLSDAALMLGITVLLQSIVIVTVIPSLVPVLKEQ